MIWYIIIGIVAYILYKFISSTNELQKQTVEQGGMLVKYSKLISYFTQIEGSKISNHSTTDVTITGNILVIIMYNLFIMQSYNNRLVIKLTMKALLAQDKISKEWEFKDTEDQEKIAEIIINEIGKYASSFIPEEERHISSDMTLPYELEHYDNKEEEYDEDVISYDPLEIQLGVLIESETTTDEEEIQELVLNNLEENPNYYSERYFYGIFDITLPDELEWALNEKRQKSSRNTDEIDDLPF